MEHLSNEQKAKELCDACPNCTFSCGDRLNCKVEDKYNIAMKMAEWKDEWFKEILRKELNDALDWSNEDHETEKQKLIDNLREVLSAHMHGGEIDEVLAELDEKMKGE